VKYPCNIPEAAGHAEVLKPQPCTIEGHISSLVSGSMDITALVRLG
jgi:hypothetical protein